MFGTKCEWLLSLIEWVKLAALPLFTLSTPSSEIKRSVEYIMAEVMICRGGFGSGRPGGSSSGANGFGNSGGTLTTLVFTNNEMWTVPSNIIGNDVSVRIFGGGGGGAVSSASFRGK